MKIGKPTTVLTRNLLWTIAVLFGCVGIAQAQITVTEAQIGCIDKPQSKNVGNLTSIVANACNNKFSCSFQAPDPAQYTAEGVHPYTRTFCTQAMEIRYQCVGGGGGSVEVPGDAWKNPPAQLFCEPQAPPQSNTTGSQNPLVPVLQGLLQKYKKCIVEQYESPTPPNPALGPLRDSATCVDGNTCTIASRLATFQKLQIQASRGDPTNFETMLHSAVLNDCFQCGTHAEWHTKQMHCTWDCGGNQNWATDPLHFNAGIGPCFEGCKAGVDITKLVNDVINDIHGILQGIGVAGNQEPANASGGATIATNHTIIDPGPPESCDPKPTGYFIAPADLLDWTPTDAPKFKSLLTNYEPDCAPSSGVPYPLNCTGPPKREQYNPSAALASLDEYAKLNIGANEGRLRSDLRDAAARRNPVFSLCQSAAAFAVNNTLDGNAFADLSVTGRHAFAAFRAKPPQDADILACLQNNPRTKTLSAATLQQAADKALNRAYQVLHVIRAGGWAGWTSPDRQAQFACHERNSFGYIAVSGEDDQPHRPVNNPSAEFPQYDLEVPVLVRGTNHTMPVHTRYMIAHTFPPADDQLSSCSSAARTVPTDRTPVLASNAIVFLYIHGMDSRLEEALDLTHALHALGHQRAKNYTVISMDLPTSGYADNIDYNAIAPLTADGHAGGGVNLVDGLTFDPTKYNVPIVNFIEDFIVSFVNMLDHSIHVTQHPIFPIGGSLGGNMSFRLGRPRSDAPWITTVIPWSPAAIWPSFADNAAEHAALATSWYLAGGDPTYGQETPGSRRSFFYGGFDWASKVALVYEPSGGGKPQAYFWYREGWKCKSAHVKQARIDRYETYDENFRRWHWRLGMEQLMFSQQNPIPGTNPPQPLYLTNTKRMLLFCGIDDTGGNLCQETRNVAPKMEMTPGHAVFLQTTGHSIHNERPNFLAKQIADFVDALPPQGITASNGTVTGIVIPAQPALSATVCPTVDAKSCTRVSSRPPGAPLMDIVIVKSGSTPVAGASVSIIGQVTETSLTNASGVAVITHLGCYAPGSQVPRVGQTAFPARIPVPCEATASKAGYQSSSFALP
jgi:hypothetical protein